MHAPAELGRKVDGGGVGRRYVRGGEHDAASKMEVRNEAAIRGEVPAENDGFDARAVHRAVRSENGVSGHDFDGVFKVAA